ncbi:MAG TPA: hypothetical protein PK388_06185, partial [Kiritimatiellia bacterium]|nr:hypothetical protein [Kiritimatiellia bacterium]
MRIEIRPRFALYIAGALFGLTGCVRLPVAPPAPQPLPPPAPPLVVAPPAPQPTPPPLVQPPPPPAEPTTPIDVLFAIQVRLDREN